MFAAKNAKKACIGGKSHVRSKKDRSNKLFEDQFVGQIGHMAGSSVIFDTVRPYRMARDDANENPQDGDGGSDIPGYNIDIKTSFMRGKPDPLKYNCIVRPAEYDPSRAYIQTLVKEIDTERYEAIVYVVGWITGNELPDEVEKSGMFEGAYVLPTAKLRPMNSFKPSNFSNQKGD